VVLCALFMSVAFYGLATAQTPEAQGAIVQKIGAIKTIQDTSIQMNTDSGEQVSLEVSATARIVRIAPGEKDIKNAVPSQLSELKVGDRILARGHIADQSGKILASSIVVMKLEDVKTHQQQDLQDWQKRGSGGVVKTVDAASGTITIAGSPGNDVSVHTSSKTIFRRYAQDSWKYDDAKSGTLQDIQPGDQLRARGNRSADGKEIVAEEIVSGLFRDLSGTVASVDAGAGTFSIKDVQSKKTFVVKVIADSRTLQVPAPMAERIAMRLKAGTAGTAASSGSAPQQAPVPANAGQNGAADSQRQFGGTGGSGRAPDFQQILSHLPTIQLTDLHAGDAVMVLTTQGAAEHVTAVTLLSGVDAILRASPNSSQAMNLGSWSLGSSGAEAAAP
jgi:Domain of unknown function (DUF5666)